jgi:uncharacterized YigZ family protein
MQTIDTTYTNTLEIKQSKFIAYFVPYQFYKKTLEKLKNEHPKARHFVTATRYINEFDQVVESSSDDGEPKGTSGKPTLAVIQGQELINIGIITIRYFGGTKLGTGGLVRAYSEATNLVLQTAELLEYKKEIQIDIEVAYSDLSIVEYEIKKDGITIVNKEFLVSEVVVKISATTEVLEIFLEKVKWLVCIKQS